MPYEHNLDHELDELSYRVSLDLLAEKIEDEIRNFAAETVDSSRGDRMEDTISNIQALGELRRLAEQTEEARATSAVGDFVTRLVDAPITMRSNSKKLSEFQILFSAACTLAVTGEDEPAEAWQILEEKIAFASNALEDLDHEGFRKAIVAAFKAVVHRSDFSFVALDAAIKNERNLADLRFIRRKLGIRPHQASHTKISVG